MQQDRPPQARWSRRRFLRSGLGIGVGAVSLGTIGYWLGLRPAAPGSSTSGGPGAILGSPAGASGAPDDTAAGRRSFRSRPDLSPPVISVTSPAAHDVAPGFVFFTPNNGQDQDGPMIADNQGDLVWIRPDTGQYATNFRVSSYRGNPVLTWWEGANNAGLGQGEFVIADRSYRQIARVRAVGGLKGDLHEFLITPQGTALFLAGGQAPADASALASPPPWQVWDFAVQEVDIETGAVLFDWHTRDHIGVDESFVDPPTASDAVYDYAHANSIEIDTDGHLLVSARNTSAIYKVDRGSGAILWRLGGKRNDFVIGGGAAFAWQHDVRRQSDGRLTVFDNESAPGQSRAIVLRLDEVAMTATLEQAYGHPQALLATSQGNVQVLPNGNLFVGWGSAGAFSENRRDGSLAFDAAFPAAKQSYRCFRFPWIGAPADLPALAVESDGDIAVAAHCRLERGNVGPQLGGALRDQSGRARLREAVCPYRLRDADHCRQSRALLRRPGAGSVGPDPGHLGDGRAGVLKAHSRIERLAAQRRPEVVVAAGVLCLVGTILSVATIEFAAPGLLLILLGSRVQALLTRQPQKLSSPRQPGCSS